MVTRSVGQILLDADIFLACLKALVTEGDLDLLDGGMAFVSEACESPSEIVRPDSLEPGFSGVFPHHLKNALGGHALPTHPITFVHGTKHPARSEARRRCP